MTNTPDNSNQQTDTSKSRNWRRIVIISGLGLGTVSVAGGAVGTWWFQEKLAPMVSEDLTKLTQRPVQVGELKKFRIGYLEFGPSSLPPTSTDSIAASTEVVKVRYALGPLLFKTLKLDITFGKSEANLQQQADGSFKVPELADLPPPPIDVDITALRFPEVDVTIIPSETGKSSEPILLDLSNIEVLSKDKMQRWLIDLNGKVIDGGGNFQVDADVNLKNSEIKADVVAQKLQLPIFVPLALAFENIPDVSLQNGELNADLRTQVKLTDKVADLVQNIQGKVSLRELNANSSLLSNTVNLNTVANVAWPKVTVENLNANYGNIGLKLHGTAQTTADLDFQNLNLNLNAEVLPVSFETLFNTVTTEIDLLSGKIETAETKQQLQQIRSQIQDIRPLLDGGVKTNFSIVGSLLQPVVSGKVQTTEVTRVDRLRFQDIATNFTISPQLNQEFQPLNLTAGFSDLQITPVVGGKITGKGEVRSQKEEVKIQKLVGANGIRPHFKSQKLGVGSQSVPQTQKLEVGSRKSVPQSQNSVGANGIRPHFKSQKLGVGSQSVPQTQKLEVGSRKSVPQSQNSVGANGIRPHFKSQKLGVGSQSVPQTQKLEVGSRKSVPQSQNFLGHASLRDATQTQTKVKIQKLEVASRESVPQSQKLVGANGIRPHFKSQNLGVGSQSVPQKLEVASRESVSKEQESNFNPVVDLNLKVENVPLEPIAQQYGITSPLPLGDFSTEVAIAGALESLKGQVLWQLPNAVYPVSGTVDIINSQANIKNTVVEVGGGKVNIDGTANLDNWQLNVTVNQINLDNLEPLKPLGLPSGLEGIVNAEASSSGLTRNFSINTIDGNGSGVINIAGGQVNFNARANNGNLQGKGNAVQLSLSALERIGRNASFLTTANPILSSKTDGKVNGEATFSANLNDLSLPGITSGFQGNVNLANGTVNVNGKVNNGRFQALVDSEDLLLNPLLDLGLSAVNSGIITDQEQLNNIRANIPRLKTLNGRLNGQVNLSGNLVNPSPENIAGDLVGNLKIEEGTINATGSLKSGDFQTTVKTNQISLTAVEKLLTEAQIVSLKNNVLPTDTEGEVQGEATVSGNINNLTPAGIAIDGDGKVIIAGGTVNATGKLNNGNFQASVNSSKLAVNPLLDLGEAVLTSGLIPVEANQVQILQAQIPAIKTLNSQVNVNANLSGSLNNLSPEAITADTNTKLFIDKNTVDIDGRLERGNFFANVETENIALRYLEETVRKTGLIAMVCQGECHSPLPPGIEGEIFGNLSVFGNLNNLNPQAIAADGTGKLIIGNNTINATGKLDNGNFTASAIAEPIPLSFVKKIAQEIGVVPPEALPYLETINGNILGSAKVAGNLENLNPEAIAAETEGKVILTNGGAVNITGELVGKKWQTAVVGEQIPLEQFSAALEKQEQTKPAVAGIRQVQKLLGQAENLPLIGGFLNTNIDLSGTLANLSPEAIAAQAKLTLSELPVIQQPLNSLFDWKGKQVEIEKVSIPPNVNANGVVGVDFPQQKPPTISGININVNLSDFDLESLPIEKLAQAQNLPIEKKGELLTGRVNFDGKVIGQSIEDLSLVGDVVLRNLTVNSVDFDSVLSGKLNAGITDGVTFKIAGEQDRLELVLDRFEQTYFPTAFLIQRDEAKLAGVTEGENLLVTLEQFPVELLDIAPAAQFDIGPVSGEASAKIAISGLRTFDLNSITANGNLAVAKPSIGYIDAESFTADINFAKGVGTLNDGTLLLGDSRYILQAMVDINSPAANFDPKFAGNLKIEKGEAQDILTALQWFNLEDIARGIATPNYANAEDVQPVAVGFPENTPVISQLRRFAEIQALLKQQQESQQPNIPIQIPPLADLDITFSAEVAAEGTWQSGIDGKFDINGSDWSWGPYKIDKFLLEGQYENEVLTVKPLEVQVGETLLAFNGDLSPENQTGKLQLENIDLAEIQKFAQNYIPPNINVNITGILNAETEIGGNFEDPRAVGEINIVDGTLNEKPIEKAQTEFSYNTGRLRFGGGISIIGDPILYRGDIPIDLPFAQVSAGSDLINVSVNIKNDALQIVNILTDQVTLNSGQGDILLQVKGTLQQPEPEGYAKFANMSITAAAFPQPLTDLTGTVLFQGDRIEVKELQGILSDGKVEVIGVLPIFQPFGSQEPDINNPLTITLDQLNINFQRVFQGGIDGKVVITGAALQPEIGGNVEVSQGRIFLNQAAGFAAAAGNGENAPDFGIEIGLNNFQVILSDRLLMISPGLANFEVAGGLLINGTLNNISPSGKIDLVAGVINLFTTELRLDPNYKNTATFTPINGLDPIVDVQLLASAFETNRSSSPSSPLSSETIDAPSPGTLNSSQKVRIMATAKGPLSELENNLELTSAPKRSEVQIVSLLGGNIINTLSEDRNLALANVASTTILANLQQDIIAATGLSEFRIFPASIPKRGARRASSLGWGLEVGVDVTNQLGVSMTRLFGANEPTEFSLRYQVNDEVRVRGGSNFNDNAVLSVEYEVQF
ncbi:translocation/assembly module TamB domain-containing protein [Okeania sp. SIO2B3]|uniref:translocation/assembly module TamB domain-containing protein n=1 Tax=Okeania sp. SIO2B3 TaxID=2607784 RepID=UPI0013C1B1A6|nr:translocation/assembly module TamB domain-containing protein [Okeania sp. SIO2B3]NET41504.1 DUF748 domain-containing protein [Okeania sp. SIO2B3]